MARKKATAHVLTPKEVTQQQFNLTDSFASLLLGVVVVVAAIVLFFSFIRGTKHEVTTPPTLSTEKLSQELEKTNKEDTKTTKSVYTVVAGDTLWSISEKFYNSGFEWQKIAKANNITDPANLEKGTKITIPGADTRILATSTSVAKEQEEAKMQAQQQVAQPQTQIAPVARAISGDSYTVMHGDDLWDIAVRAYGDGYKWVEIARANNLANPNLIHADNILKLPR